MSVVGVDDHRAGPQRGQRSEPPEESRLRRVRVDHMRAKAPGDRRDPGKGGRVEVGARRLAEAGEELGPGSLAPGEIGHRLLAGGERAVDEDRLVAARVQPSPAQQRHMLGGPAQVQPGDDPEDADAAQARRSEDPLSRRP